MENFVTAHMEAIAESIPIKPNQKPNVRVQWESLVVRKKTR